MNKSFKDSLDVASRLASRVPDIQNYMEFMEYTVFMEFKKFTETQSRKLKRVSSNKTPEFSFKV